MWIASLTRDWADWTDGFLRGFWRTKYTLDMEAIKTVVSVVAIVSIAVQSVSSGSTNQDAIRKCSSDTVAANDTLLRCSQNLGFGGEENKQWNQTEACSDPSKYDDYFCIFEGTIGCHGINKYTSVFELPPEQETLFKDFSPAKAFNLTCQIIDNECGCASPGSSTHMTTDETLFTFLPRLIDTAQPSCDFLTCVDNLDAQNCNYPIWLYKRSYEFVARKEYGWPEDTSDSGEFRTLMGSLCNTGVTNLNKDCAISQANTTAFKDCVKRPLADMDKPDASKNDLCSAFHATDGCLDRYMGADSCDATTAKLMKLGVDVKKPLRVLTKNCPVGSAGSLAGSFLVMAAALIAVGFF